MRCAMETPPRPYKSERAAIADGSFSFRVASSESAAAALRPSLAKTPPKTLDMRLEEKSSGTSVEESSLTSIESLAGEPETAENQQLRSGPRLAPPIALQKTVPLGRAKSTSLDEPKGMAPSPKRRLQTAQILESVVTSTISSELGGVAGPQLEQIVANIVEGVVGQLDSLRQLHAEREQLQQQVAEAQMSSLRAEMEALKGENQRLRADRHRAQEQARSARRSIEASRVAAQERFTDELAAAAEAVQTRSSLTLASGRSSMAGLLSQVAQNNRRLKEELGN